MRLVAFRIENYKKIRDTGWITVRDLTAFVGKNEAGKSALFRGLSKLNPSDGEKYDGLKEFPRRRYTDEFNQQDWPVASGRFELSDEERKELTQICGALHQCTYVVCTRHYSWKLTVEFEPVPSIVRLTRNEFLKELEDLEITIRDLTAPEGKGETLVTIKNEILNSIFQAKSHQSSRNSDEIVPRNETEMLLNAITTHANENWEKEILASVRQRAEKLHTRCDLMNSYRRLRSGLRTTCRSLSILTATMSLIALYIFQALFSSLIRILQHHVFGRHAVCSSKSVLT